MAEARQKIKCPQCEQPTIWHSSNPFRPFCSRKCKLIDLGEWLDENRTIPGQRGYGAESPDVERDNNN